MERIISPTNDFLFKCLFGRKGSEDVLLSFLNAIMQDCGETTFESVEIEENTELPKEEKDGKMSIIDVKATLPDHSKVNIEIQLKNQKNMDKRTLYYWSKLYAEKFKEGQQYNELNRVITINIIDFNYFKDLKYHNHFKVMNVESPHQILSDDLDIHFIQLPKYRGLPEKDYTQNSLHRWLTFLQKEIPDDVLKELITLDTNLKVANEKLETLLADDETKALAWERERAIIEYNSQIGSAKEEGVAEGIEIGVEIGIEKGRKEEREIAEQKLNEERLIMRKEKLERAKEMIDDGLSIEKVSKFSGLSVEEIEEELSLK